MLSSIVNQILTVSPVLVYVLVGALVFAEDAIFVGFVIPGETAALLGGVDASRGNVNVYAVGAIVVVAAIVGDTVGYEIGKHVGERALRWKPLRKRKAGLDSARDLLAHRGGAAVFLGRFVAFFRAVMPALAGTSRMPYLRFLRWNALGGLVWGVGYVLLGYLAGNFYAAVAHPWGRRQRSSSPRPSWSAWPPGGSSGTVASARRRRAEPNSADAGRSGGRSSRETPRRCR